MPAYDQRILRERRMFLMPKQGIYLSYAEENRSLSWLWRVVLVCVMALWSCDAFAQASTLGLIICNIKTNVGAYSRIVNATAYIVGSFFAARFLFLLKRHGDNPAQSQITSAAAHFVAAMALLSFPSFIGALQGSLFGSGVDGTNNFGCNPDGVTSSSGTIGLDQMIQNFVKDIYVPMFQILAVISIMAGLTFIVGGLLRGAKTGVDPRAADPKTIVSHLVFGAILISIGSVLPDMLKSIFGSSNVSSMTSAKLISWTDIVGSSANTEAMDNTVRAVLAFIQIIGAISFVRGWLLLKKAVEGGGQATLPQGLTHIIGGAIAINIDVFLRAMDKTFGTSVTTST